MTLLNTVSNLGGVWPSSLSLWAVDGLTWKTCTGVAGNIQCNTADEKKVQMDLLMRAFHDTHLLTNIYVVYNSVNLRLQLSG